MLVRLVGIAVLGPLLSLAATSPIAVASDYSPIAARSAQRWLESAREDLESLRYEQARQGLKWSLQTGAASVDGVIEVYRLLAETSAALDDQTGAENAFANLLSLVPSFTLAPGTSPKIERPFRRASDWMKGQQPLSVQMIRLRNDFKITVTSDPTHLIAALRLSYVALDGTRKAVLADLLAQNEVTIAVPEDATSDVVASALDTYGNNIIPDVVRVKSVPLKVDVPVRSLKGSVWKSPWPYAGAAVTAAAITLGFGLKANMQRTDLSTCDKNPAMCFPDVYDRTDRAANQNVSVALVSLGATAVFSALAVWFAVQSKQDSTSGSR